MRTGKKVPRHPSMKWLTEEDAAIYRDRMTVFEEIDYADADHWDYYRMRWYMENPRILATRYGRGT